MARNGKEHAGTFAQQRQENRLLKNRLSLVIQRLNGHRTDPYKDVPETTRYTLTPEIKARAEELAAAEQSLPILQRQGYSRILAGLLDGTIS